MSDIELLSIGDASLDVFIAPSESEALCQLDDKECLICFTYGDKIPVKSLDFSIGGNAANNAVGSSRLGVKVGSVITLGADSIGNQILETLKNENVDTTLVVQKPDMSSNYSVVINYSGERTIFTYKAPGAYQFPEVLPPVPWFYLTSMAEGFQPVYDRLFSELKSNPSLHLAFNPGSRQIRAGFEAIKNILSVCYIIYVNREEAEAITSFGESQGKEKDLLKALSSLGPKVPIITDGENGSYVYDGQKFIHAGVLPIDAFERTGAGDAFGSGCLSALIKGKSLEEALLWGSLNSASVIGYVGPQKGLLRDSEMPIWIDRAKSSKLSIEEF